MQALRSCVISSWIFVKGLILDNSQVILLFLGATVLHYASAIAYVKWCAPPTFIGFILSPFMTVTPLCVGIRWSITIFGDYLSSIWTFMFLWVSSNIIKRFSKDEIN